MTTQSRIVVMLWEIWRVTRVEAAWKLAFGIVGGLAVLALCAAVAPAAMRGGMRTSWTTARRSP